MTPVYVSGHRNPDTDSIVSAMAYAALKNALGERDVVAVRLGEINSETSVVLDYFGFEPPMLINNVKTQLSDVAFDTPPVVGSQVTVRKVWDIMREHKLLSIPIADEDNRLAGVLATSDIAEHDMSSAINGFAVETTALNLASALEGCLIGGGEDWDMIGGEIQIAVHSPEHITADLYKNCVLIAGNQKGIIEAAQNAQVACLVLCQVDAGSDAAEECRHANIHIILTHYDPYRASRLISHAVPASRLMKNESITTFHVDDFLDDVREVMLKNRAPSYPVLDVNEQVVGVVSRFHLLNHSKKQVILVDHNEKAQSIPGLEQAEILEIIDHHRLADLQTGLPVYFRNEPVGSATTIVAAMFFEHGVTPRKAMAGLIAGAIMSDTVMFKSPTCTEKDRRMAHRMAQLAGIDLTELGREIFSATSSIADKEAGTLIHQDFKEFILGDHKVGIGQITCMDVRDLADKEEALLVEMESIRKQRGLEYVFLMETQIVDEGTRMLFTGKAERLLHDSFGEDKPIENNAIFLPKVMSRKKQVVPAISAVLG